MATNHHAQYSFSLEMWQTYICRSRFTLLSKLNTQPRKMKLTQPIYEYIFQATKKILYSPSSKYQENEIVNH